MTTSEVPNVTGSVTEHDSLCPVRDGSCCPWMGDCVCQCLCEFINEIRKDQQRKDADYLAEYTEDNHEHVGGQLCSPHNGDRCDITAALRVVVQHLRSRL